MTDQIKPPIDSFLDRMSGDLGSMVLGVYKYLKQNDIKPQPLLDLISPETDNTFATIFDIVHKLKIHLTGGSLWGTHYVIFSSIISDHNEDAQLCLSLCIAVLDKMISELIPRLTILNDDLTDYNQAMKIRDDNFLAEDQEYSEILNNALKHHTNRVENSLMDALIDANFYVKNSSRYHQNYTYSHDGKYLNPPPIRELSLFYRIVGQHTMASCLIAMKNLSL